MNAEAAWWAGGFGAAIQWFKALPLKGNWAKVQPAIALGLCFVAAYAAYLIGDQASTHQPWRDFLANGRIYLAVVGSAVQLTSTAATMAVNVGLGKPDQPLFPVSNTGGKA